MHKQLIITGFHRSGTSMLAQEFHNAGLFIGERLLGPHISNVDGHYEDFDFFNVHDKILASHNTTWQYSSKESLSIEKQYEVMMDNIIDVRNKKYEQWGFKDPRTALFLPQWHNKLDDPHTVIIYRHYEECVNSLLHRASRQISDNISSDISFWEDPTLAYKMWLTYNQHILNYVEKYPNSTIVISHTAMLNGFPIIQTVNEKFGFTLDVSVESAVKKELLSPQNFSSYSLEDTLKKELDETWDKLQELSISLSEKSRISSEIKVTNSFNELKNVLTSLSIDIEEKNPIQNILDQLYDENIEINKKISLIKKNRSLFIQFKANDALIEAISILIEKNYKAIELYFIISEVYALEKKYQQAELYSLKVFTVADKVFPYFYNSLGRLYLQINNLILSENAINEAIKLNSKNPNFYITRSILEHKKGNYEDALSNMDKALALQIDKPDTEVGFTLQKINILLELNDLDTVKELLTKLDEQHPNNVRIQKSIKNILNESEVEIIDKEKEKQLTLIRLKKDENYFSKIVAILNSIKDKWSKDNLLNRLIVHLEKLDLDKNMKRVCIIILGMHRSGTSCLMGSLEKVGLFSGDISTWNPHNLKGNREHFSIVALNDKLLKFNNSSWDNPPSDTIVWNDEHKIERDAIIEEFMKISMPFIGFKDPRTIFTLPFWVEGFNSKMTIKYVGSFRNPSSVIASLQKRNTQMSFENALELWKKYNQRLWSYYDKVSFPLISFDKDEDEYKHDIQNIVKILGLNYQSVGNDFFYDTSLNNQKTTKNSIEDPEALSLYQTLQQFSFQSFLERREKKLTIIINFYNMKREAKRTLFTLTEEYQRLSSELYDVIVIDNGSTEPLDEDLVKSFGSNFFYIFYNSKYPSPVEAINYCAKMVKSEYIMCLIDGARMLSPGILQYSFDAWKLSNHPFVYTIGMHIGEEMQNIAMEKGYDQEVEDKLLSTIDWQENGYKLFSISSLAASSKNGFFSMISESNCFSLKRNDFLAIGGFNEKFISPGAGLVNLDFFNKVNNQLEIMSILLLGEATFHQFHGGVATNVPMKEHPFSKMDEEYKSIYGTGYSQKWKKPYYFGTYNKESKKIYE